MMANKTNNKELAATSKEISVTDMRDTLARSMAIPSIDPKHLIPTAYNKLIAEKDAPESEEEKAALMEQLIFTLGFENDYTLVETIDEKYRGMAVELRRQLIKDFDCKTYAEKVLVDTIVSGYMRTIRCARAFNNGTHAEFLSSQNNQYMSIMSKEMDRAQRQLMSAYQTLINLKRPPLKVQIKAKTAFIAHNQQLNATEPVAQKDHSATIKE